MQLFRIHIRTGDAANHARAFAYCLREQVLGTGWQVDLTTREDVTWRLYEQLANDKFPGKWHGFSYIYRNVQPKDLIWTRDERGSYYLAQVQSSWEYLDTEEGRKVDIANVVRCNILPVPSADDVPGKIVACFRSPRTIQRINDTTANSYSCLLWNQLAESEDYLLQANGASNLFAYLDSEATEDIIFVYLQTQGWLILPNSRKVDTMNYEFIAKNRETFESAIVQVKTGSTQLNTQRNEWSNAADQVFLFQANGKYRGPKHEDVRCLMPDHIEKFVRANLQILPGAVKRSVMYLDNQGTG